MARLDSKIIQALLKVIGEQDWYTLQGRHFIGVGITRGEHAQICRQDDYAQQQGDGNLVTIVIQVHDEQGDTYT